MENEALSIGEVAQVAGVRTSRLRYYERIGLLPAAERVAGQRRYDRSILRRLAVIDVAQRAGLSLDEIGELLDAGTEPVSDRLREVAARKLPELDALIDRATRVRGWLTAATGCDCESLNDCPLFDEDAPLPAAGIGQPLGLDRVDPPARA